jgi:hypothetical protein
MLDELWNRIQGGFYGVCTGIADMAACGGRREQAEQNILVGVIMLPKRARLSSWAMNGMLKMG